MAKSSIQAPRGTRDFYPEEMRQRTWLFDNFRGVAGKFGFEEVDAPILEHAELFTRKAGEEIVDQLYHFELHDRHLALRPEMTPSIARLVMGRAGGLKLPLRWFTITQNWRYERMTRGRLREHYQWNMDIWGEPGVTAEAELIAALLTLVREIGLPSGAVKVRVNSRALLEESLRQGVLAERPEAFAPLCVIIDKLDKIGEQAVRDLLCAPDGEIALQPPEADSVLKMLQARTLEEAAAAGGALRVGWAPLCGPLCVGCCVGWAPLCGPFGGPPSEPGPDRHVPDEMGEDSVRPCAARCSVCVLISLILA